MTEQPPPSAEAQALAETIYKWQGYAFLDGRVAQAIDALILQRVSADTERWQNRDRQRLEQIDRLQETVQSFQSARAERPAPEGPQAAPTPAPGYAVSDRSMELARYIREHLGSMSLRTDIAALVEQADTS